MNLTDREWKEFYVLDLFDSLRGNQNKMNSLSTGNDILISAKNTDNGVKGFYKKNTKKNYRGHCITLNNDGDGGVGLSYYQPYKFLLDSHVYALYSQVNISKQAYIFIAKSLSTQRCCFSHGRSISQNRLEKMKIMLPINDKSNPDYAFMDAYVKEEEKRKKEKHIAYAKKQLESLEYVEVPTLEDKEWKPFVINELFEKIDAGKGKGLNHLSKVDNNGVNYIGATHRNNGVLCQIGIEDTSSKMIQQGNCVGFIRNGNGSVGYAVYKAEHFVSTSDVSFAYSQTMNKYIGLFIVTSSNLIRGKYNHNYKRTPERLKKDGIMLPVSKTGIPDYLYMEQYAKNITITKLKKYLSFVGQEVN